MADAEIVDLRDHTCLPGLIDMHVHVDGYPEDADDYRIYLRRTHDDTMKIAAEISEIILKSGFTTARNVGTYMAWVARDVRDQIDAGEVPGPRLRVAGIKLTAHAHSAESIKDAILAGVDSIKIRISQ